MPLYPWLTYLKDNLPARARHLEDIPGGIVDTTPTTSEIPEVIHAVHRSFYDVDSPFSLYS